MPLSGTSKIVVLKQFAISCFEFLVTYKFPAINCWWRVATYFGEKYTYFSCIFRKLNQIHLKFSTKTIIYNNVIIVIYVNMQPQKRFRQIHVYFCQNYKTPFGKKVPTCGARRKQLPNKKILLCIPNSYRLNFIWSPFFYHSLKTQTTLSLSASSVSTHHVLYNIYYFKMHNYLPKLFSHI